MKTKLSYLAVSLSFQFQILKSNWNKTCFITKTGEHTVHLQYAKINDAIVLLHDFNKKTKLKKFEETVGKQ